MSKDFFAVKEIWQEDDRTLGIVWTDQKKSLLDVVHLRKNCPCASCIDEKTGQKILKDEEVSETVRPKKISSLGSYAVSINFTDGHSTGIYSFKRLRALHPSPC